MSDYSKAGWTCESLTVSDDDGHTHRDNRVATTTKDVMLRSTMPSRSSSNTSTVTTKSSKDAAKSSTSTGRGATRRRDLMEALRTFTREQVSGSGSKRKSAHTPSRLHHLHTSSDAELSLQQWNRKQSHMAAYSVPTSYGVDAEKENEISDARTNKATEQRAAKADNSADVNQRSIKSKLHSRSRSLFAHHGQLFGGKSNTETSSKQRATHDAAMPEMQGEILTYSQPRTKRSTSFSKGEEGVAGVGFNGSGIAPRERTLTHCGTISRPSTASSHGWLVVDAGERAGSMNDGTSIDLSGRRSTSDIPSASNDPAAHLASQILRPCNMAPDPTLFGRRSSTAARRYAANVMDRTDEGRQGVQSAKRGRNTALDIFQHGTANEIRTVPLPPRRQTLRARVQSSSDVRELSSAVRTLSIEGKTNQRVEKEAETKSGHHTLSPKQKARVLPRRTSESSLGASKSSRPSTADQERPSRAERERAKAFEHLGQRMSLPRVESSIARIEKVIARRASEDVLRSCARVKNDVKRRASNEEAHRSVSRDNRTEDKVQSSKDFLSRHSLSSVGTDRTASSMISDNDDDEDYADEETSEAVKNKLGDKASWMQGLSTDNAKDELDDGRFSPTSFASAKSETWGSCYSSASSLAAASPPSHLRAPLPASSLFNRRQPLEEQRVPPVPIVPAKYASQTTQIHYGLPSPFKRSTDEAPPCIVRPDSLDEGLVDAYLKSLDEEFAQQKKATLHDFGDDDDLGSICLETPTFGYVSSFTTAPALTPRASDYATFEDSALFRPLHATSSSGPQKLQMTQRPLFTRPQFRRPASMNSITSGAQSGYDTFPLMEDKDKLYPFRMNIGSVSPKTVDDDHHASHVAPHDALSEWQKRLEAARRPSEPQQGLGLSHVKLALAEKSHSLRSFSRSPCALVEEEERETADKSKQRTQGRRSSVSQQAIMALQSRSNSFRIGSNNRTRS